MGTNPEDWGVFNAREEKRENEGKDSLHSLAALVPFSFSVEDARKYIEPSQRRRYIKHN
jgi:hypothetical protein